jgi:CubicO group peptidase (beta-lactamase class C family)
MNIVVAFVLASLALRQQPVDTRKPLADELRAACAEFQTAHHIVGMSVAVLRDHDVVLDAAFGESDREAKAAATSATLYRLASVSKTVTATVVMQLVEAHKLDLDLDVHGYVKQLDDMLPVITLRQILSHTSGIRHYRDDREDGGTAHRTTSEALGLFIHDPLLFAPGVKYSYSTHAFTLAVATIESAAKRDFAAIVHDDVAAKCAPTLACEIASASEPQRTALYAVDKSGAVTRLEPRDDLSWKYGGGGLESNALDLAHFAQAVAEAKLVSAASRDAMWTRSKTNDGQPIDYGLGWAVSQDGNTISHSGSQQGTSTCLTILRAEHLVIVVLDNTENSNARELVPKLTEFATAKR